MPHLTRAGAAAVVFVTLAGACGGSDASSRAGAETGATDSAALAASAARTAEPSVSAVMIGRRVGAGNLITEPTFEFAPKDTVHVSVATEGAGGGGRLSAAWRFQSGEILQQSSQSIRPPGENTAFQLSQPKGLKPGTYKVVVFLDDDSVDTKVFVVKK